MSLIEVFTGLIFDPHGCLLVVRKRATSRFMLPGGKAEPGETALAALERELLEELGVRLVSATPFGVFEAEAANEPGRRVRGNVHRVQIAGTITPAAEIEEIAWIDPLQPVALLAPLLEHHILPALNG